ncbi:MAG: DUF2029 domain-containing protein [Deltaproteobacteria bacterium]|nr:DUF2029 domain-containing protein [Deltaproteobacteria bacterium]
MSWHEGERATVISGIICAALSLLFFWAAGLAVMDFSTPRSATGLPLAPDFSNYWAASKLALSGKAALAYNINELHEVEQQFFGTHHYYGCGWYYPPFALFWALPLGLMPYVTSLLVWTIVPLIIFALVFRRISHHPISFILFLSFPGTLINILFGQNGFLSGLLLGGGLLLLDQSPVLAGCLFGLLCYKPPLAALIMVALIFGRYWKTLISALVTLLLLSTASLIVFGYRVWIEYFHVQSVPMRLLELGGADWSIMTSVFAAVRSAGLGIQAAYLIQGLVMLAVLAAVAWVWRRRLSLPNRGAVLVLGTFLFTPYAFVYDLALLILPLGWLWEEGRRCGRLPGELLLLWFGWLMPYAAMILWNRINIFDGKFQLAPIILLMLFLLSLARARIALKQEPSDPQKLTSLAWPS